MFAHHVVASHCATANNPMITSLVEMEVDASKQQLYEMLLLSIQWVDQIMIWPLISATDPQEILKQTTDYFNGRVQAFISNMEPSFKSTKT